MFDRRYTLWSHVILLLTLIAVPVLAEESPADQSTLFGFLTATEKVYQSQLFVQPDGSLLMVWTQAGEADLDLFVASQISADAFSRPIRINRAPVNGYTGDEARPTVAFGPDGRIAVAWTAADGDIMAATGVTDGLVFTAPIKLNQDENKTSRTMPAITYTSDGVAHAVWVDGRDAPALAPAEITARALAGSDAIAVEALSMFCAMLGSASGNLALTLGARGGVYIGGGIVLRLGDFLAASAFRDRFEDKGRFRDYLSAIPTWLITADNPALRGLAALLERDT